MKKVLSFMSVLTLAIFLTFCACPGALAAPAGVGGDFNIGGGSSGGMYYAMSTTFAQFFNDVGGLGRFTAYPTTGTGQNLAFMSRGDIELAIIAGPIGVDALKGVNDWAGKQYTGLRAASFLYPTYMQFFALKGSNIKSFADLKGKKIAVGAAGGGDQFVMRKIMAGLGMTFDDIKPEYVGSGDSIELIRDGHLDCIPGFTNIPWSTVVELTNADKVELFSIEDSLIQKLTTGENAEFFPLTIPANTYKGQTTDIKTLGMGTILCVDAGVSEAEVYAMVKAIYENLQDLISRHAGLAELKPDSVNQIKGIPLHPGAEKYYKEIGALK